MTTTKLREQSASAPAAQMGVSKHRVDALTDGVFAIVMTLLVLELKIPELARNVAVRDLGRELVHDAPVLFSFVITFMFASLFWYLHHVLLNFVRELRPKLVVLNLAFLMFVSLLPFSVGMLGHYLRNPLAQTVYFGNQFAIALLLWTQWRSATGAGLVVEPGSLEARKFGVRVATLPLAAVAATVFAWINPSSSFYAFMMVTLASRGYARRLEKKK